MNQAVIRLFTFLVMTLPIYANAGLAPSGQLIFSLQTAKGPVAIANLPEATLYDSFNKNLNAGMSSGSDALQVLRDFTDKTVTVNTAIGEAVERAIDPQHKYDHFFDFIQAKENVWAVPLAQYSAGDESDDEQIYVTVNRELRGDSKRHSSKTIKWVTAMRQAMSRLPRFEGVSFRGTRLTQVRADQLYRVNHPAKDPAFISSSISPEVGFRFAHPDINGVGSKDDKTAVVFVIHGKTGRPVSDFAHMHSHEQEILFANGTPMTVTAKSPIFMDAVFGITQIVVLTEK